MLENIEDWARENVNCCACGGKLDTILNVCVTQKIATWKFPVCGRLDCPDFPPKAMAFVCEECMKNKVKIRHCVEWESSISLVTYHDIDSLEDECKVVSQMKYHFGRKFRRRRLVFKAARQEGVN